MTKLKNKLTIIASGLVTIAGHHYGSKLLDYKAEMAASKDQRLRDIAAEQDMSNVHSGLEVLSNQTKTLADKIQELVTIRDVNINKLEEVNTLLDKSNKFCDATKEILEKGSEQVTPEYYSKAYYAALKCQESQAQALKKVKSLVDLMNKNSISPPGLDSFYNYLDSLNLLELSAFFNLLILFLISILVCNIIITLISNELIIKFKLEERFPKISKILK